MNSFSGRSPEDWLGAMSRNDAPARGRLRVFLGMCPGVGKTFAMLQAAHQARQRGQRIVVGVVETHGRPETEALIRGLEVLPRKKLSYRETQLDEMDLERILSEKPEIVLVDELAHTNAPGSRHAKRYQDVEEILAAGIDVYTTLNIQHLESRNDQIAQITGVVVRETVPDVVLEWAKQIELIDLAPNELLQRLREGKVYQGERAARAQEGFFKEEHLTALRELALRFVAERVDQDLQDQMTLKGIQGPWNTQERLLVAISQSPSSARLIRRAKRMATSLEAPWIALSVNTGEVLTQEDQEVLLRHVRLARELGAEVLTISDNDVVQAIQKVSQDRNVTQVIMGRPDRRWLRDLISQGTLLDRLVRQTSKVDVHVMRSERTSRYRGWRAHWPTLKSGALSYYYSLLFMLAVSFACRAALDWIGYQALGSVFLLAILTVASLGGAGPTLLAALVAALVWNFFFIPPTWTFAINSPEDFMMVISFFVAALVGGLLTTRLRRQEVSLSARETETRLLYELVKNLASASDEIQISLILASTLERQFGVQPTVLIGHGGKLNFEKRVGPDLAEKERAVAQWSFERGLKAGWSTTTLSGAACLCLPMKGKVGVVGIIAYSPRANERPWSIATENFVESIATQTAIALERLQIREVTEANQLFAASERLHQTLLNSVSHELRTPITALIGSATALSDEVTVTQPRARNALVQEIVDSARRLDRVVENLLDISRLEKGTLALRREWFDFRDLLKDLKFSLVDELREHELIFLQQESILVEGDYRLLQHAISQVVLNASKYSPSSSPIQVDVRIAGQEIIVLVQDEGRGFPPEFESQLFEKFFRAPGTPAGGIGLGLSITKSIIELHGGSVRARNRSDRPGAEFEIRWPRPTPPETLTEAFE